MWGAWRGELFARTEKLRPWKTYAKEVRKVAPEAKPKNGSRIGAYRSLAAAGAPLRITRLGPKVPPKSGG